MLIVPTAWVAAPPPTIATEFSSVVLTHSAAMDNTTYFEGMVTTSPTAGMIRKKMTDYYSHPGQPVSSDFFLNCSAGKAYYIEKGGTCQAYDARAGQCPITYPSITIPDDAKLIAPNVTVNGLMCNEFTFYYPIFQQMVSAWVSVDKGYLVRFLGARVLTDYTALTPPSTDAFAIPTGCRGASVPRSGPAAPTFPSELSANVTMHTIESGMPHYTGEYTVYQSLKLRKMLIVQRAQGQLFHSFEDYSGSTVLIHNLVEDSIGGRKCTCVTASLPSPPEFEPWAHTPPPTFAGSKSISGLAVNLWSQSGYILPGDNFTAAFDASSALPVQWEWRNTGIRETKTYTSIDATTPDVRVFELPSECDSLKCAAMTAPTGMGRRSRFHRMHTAV